MNQIEVKLEALRGTIESYQSETLHRKPMTTSQCQLDATGMRLRAGVRGSPTTKVVTNTSKG